MLADNHPPPYYAALHFRHSAFGSSDLALRAFSVTLTLASLLACMGLAQRHLPPRVGAVFLVLLATSYALIYYAQEVRMYAVLLAFAALASVLFFGMSRRLKSGGPVALPAYGILSALCVAASFTHFFGILLAGALFFLLLLQALPARARILPIIAAGLAVLVLILGLALVPFAANPGP